MHSRIHAFMLGILALMLVAVSLLLLRQDSFVQDLNRLAQARDVAGLSAKSVEGAWNGRNPFTVFKINSAYETGRFGWRAASGKAPWGQSYVVFTTPLTSEDVGERLFETDGRRLTKFVDEREDFGWRIERHDLVVTFEIPTKSVRIQDKIAVRATGTSDNLMLRLGPNYRVKSVEGANDWIQIGGIVMVGGAKDGDRLTLDYTGVVDKPGYAGSIRANEALLTNDYWYPMIARKPAPFGIRVRTPLNWKVITHGEMIESVEKPDFRETAYEMAMPISYWSLNAGPYKVAEQVIDGRTYRCWSMALDDAHLKLQPKFFPLIVKTFEDFGKYPFSGYGSVMTPTYGGGALEGYSFVTSGYYSGEDSHELGHTWFGGMVNNTYLTSLWNESFAVWCQGYFGRNAPLGNKEERSIAFIQTPSIDEEAYNLAPLADAPAEIGPEATTLGYGKGAFVLQMLEQEIGTANFVRACRDWIAGQDRTRGGEWEDFEKNVAKASGKDLKWFFDQWVRRPGFADFEIQNVRYIPGAVVGNVTFRGQPYRISAEVLIRSGSKQEFKVVSLEGGEFRIAVTEKPNLVSFDPWRRIVRKIDASESPVDLAGTVRRFRRIDLASDKAWLQGLGRTSGKELPADLSGHFIVGTPAESPRLRDLYQRAGIASDGRVAIYKGTRVDLTKGGFVALVSLPGGKHCAIGAGKIMHPPDFGRTRLMVFDELGRFLRGESEPKTQGKFVFRL